MPVSAWSDNLDRRAEAITGWIAYELTGDSPSKQNNISPETVRTVVGEIFWLCRVVRDGGSGDPRRPLMSEYLSCLSGLLELPGGGAPNV